MRTPWGESDHQSPLIPGITFYTTPSHGGYKVSAELNQLIPGYFREVSFNEDGARGWYEEDCDWCLVFVALEAQILADQSEHSARARQTIADGTHLFMLRQYKPEVYERFTGRTVRKESAA